VLDLSAAVQHVFMADASMHCIMGGVSGRSLRIRCVGASKNGADEAILPE
jgi:hypothetical protein